MNLCRTSDDHIGLHEKTEQAVLAVDFVEGFTQLWVV